jgi:lactate permease
MFQFITSNFVSVPLTDIVAALTAALAVVGLTRLTPNASWAVREPGVGHRGRAGHAPQR